MLVRSQLSVQIWNLTESATSFGSKDWVRRNEILILLHAQILSFTCESGPFADRRGVVRPLQPPLVAGLFS